MNFISFENRRNSVHQQFTQDIAETAHQQFTQDIAETAHQQFTQDSLCLFP